MITNTVKPFRLNKDLLLKDDPICLETKSFSKKYDATVKAFWKKYDGKTLR